MPSTVTVVVPGVGQCLLQRRGVVAAPPSAPASCWSSVRHPAVGEQPEPGHLQGHRRGVELLGRLRQRGLVGDPGLRGRELGLRLLHPGHVPDGRGGGLSLGLVAGAGWGGSWPAAAPRPRPARPGRRRGPARRVATACRLLATASAASVRLFAGLGRGRSPASLTSPTVAAVALQDVAVAVERRDVRRARRAERAPQRSRPLWASVSAFSLAVTLACAAVTEALLPSPLHPVRASRRTPVRASAAGPRAVRDADRLRMSGLPVAGTGLLDSRGLTGLVPQRR